VGNVLEKQGQQLIVVNTGRYKAAQKYFSYEQFDRLSGTGEVPMWYIGAEQDPGTWTFQPTTYQTLLREGNRDWLTRTASAAAARPTRARRSQSRIRSI
jgi:hypothetical protein